MEQQSLCTTTAEPVLSSPRATTTEARAPRACAPQQENHRNEGHAHRNKEQPPLAATREKPARSTKDPTQPKINK